MGFRGLTLLLALSVAAVACGDEGGQKADVALRDNGQVYEGSFTVLQAAGQSPMLCHAIQESFPPQCAGLPVSGWDWDAVEGEETANGTSWGSWHVTGTYDGERFHLTDPPGPARQGGEDEDNSDFSPACEEPDVVDGAHGIAEWEAMSQDYGPFEIPDLVAAWVSDPAGEWDGAFVASVVVLPGAGQRAVDRIRKHYAGPLCVVERDGPTAAELAAAQHDLTDDEARAILGPIQDAYAAERRGVVVARVWVADDVALDYVDRRWGDLIELHGLLQPVE